MRLSGLLATVLLLLSGIDRTASSAELPEKPNIVIVFCDDLGYGDLSCYGHPTIRTPQLDRMASEGIRMTQFYVGASVCTPSRAALLTGRLPIRSGMCSDRSRVLFPDSKGGIPAEEITLAEALKAQGYATGCIGKWHLGHLPQYLPTNNGFDSYFGIPYSNDMDRTRESPRGREAFWNPKSEYFNVPLLRDTKTIERPADQTTITKRYTEEAVRFIDAHQDEPFFLYLAHSLPHVPLFRSEEFAGRSARGLYGDVIEEIDWSVGQVLDAIRQRDLTEKTLVVFTSDNGPWLIFNTHGGSAGLLRNGKGSTWEGGMREPGIIWGPGFVPGGRVAHDLATTMDLYTTAITLAGGEVPSDRVVDGVDLTPLLTGTGSSPRNHVHYYRGRSLYAIREGAWKAHFITRDAYTRQGPVTHKTPELYNLLHDPSETQNVANEHPDVIERLRKAAQKHLDGVDAPPSQLDRRG